MTRKDQLKVMQVGFIILRRDDINLVIRSKSAESPNEWHAIDGPFSSKEEMEKRVGIMLDQHQMIED